MSFLKLYFISVKANIKLFDISSTTNLILDSYILFPYTIIDAEAAIFSNVVCESPSWNYLSVQMTLMKIVYFVNDLFCPYKNRRQYDLLLKDSHLVSYIAIKIASKTFIFIVNRLRFPKLYWGYSLEKG